MEMTHEEIAAGIHAGQGVRDLGDCCNPTRSGIVIDKSRNRWGINIKILWHDGTTSELMPGSFAGASPRFEVLDRELTQKDRLGA